MAASLQLSTVNSTPSARGVFRSFHSTIIVNSMYVPLVGHQTILGIGHGVPWQMNATVISAKPENKKKWVSSVILACRPFSQVRSKGSD